MAAAEDDRRNSLFLGMFLALAAAAAAAADQSHISAIKHGDEQTESKTNPEDDK